jgi:TPR repeat protein
MRRFACLGLDQAAACQWLREGGHSNPLEEGAILLNTGKKDRALPLLRQACDAGKSEGCLAYGANMAVTDNARRAEQTAYFRKACNLGEKRACDLLPK